MSKFALVRVVFPDGTTLSSITAPEHSEQLCNAIVAWINGFMSATSTAQAYVKAKPPPVTGLSAELLERCHAWQRIDVTVDHLDPWVPPAPRVVEPPPRPRGMTLVPGAVVTVRPDSTLYAIMGPTATVGRSAEVPVDDIDYVALLDPIYRRPRICLRDHCVLPVSRVA